MHSFIQHTKRFILALHLMGALFLSWSALAQHQEVGEKPAIWKGAESEKSDSTSLLSAFRRGKMEGHFRYFFSGTDNAAGLTDYFANAIGGGLRYESADFHGFQMGISGFYVFNIGSSDFTRPDPTTKMANRYEIGLFDVEDPTNKKDIDRLEELYIKYHYKNSFIRFGRQLINTPFINLQDGRMRPTGVEGVWFETGSANKLQLQGGWIYAISPRGTVKWFDIKNSVGVYPSGISTSGKRSDYTGNLESDGVFLLGIKHKTTQWLTLSLWNQVFENIQNSALLQADVNAKRNETNTLIAGVQFIRQDALNDGGNPDQSKTYIDKGSSAMVLGGRVGIRKQELELTANYTHILNDGRYLMPREWGRDPFYTFMPRERNEGFGNVHAAVAKASYSFKKPKIATSLAAGYFRMPDVKDVALNKYGLPSYTQINADVRRSFSGGLKGLDAQLLVVAKINQGEMYGERKYEFNKVNMVLYNLVLNYRF